MPVIETYEYDYLGNRTAKTSGGVKTEYTTDLSTGYSQVLMATNGSDSVYYTRGFELISRQEGSDVSFYLYDGGLSVRALTNEVGAVTDTLVFDAFGNETAKTGSTDDSYGFQGEEKDETGLYYLRARYMDPSTGTFTSMDTYGGSLSDPMSLHKYLFANSNPVMYSDPSGHFSLEEFDISAAIDSVLESAVMYCLDWLVNDPESENHSIGDLLITLFIAFVTGGLGGLLSSALGADSLFGSIAYKFFYHQKLSNKEVVSLMAIALLSIVMLPVGIVLRIIGHECDDSHVGQLVESAGDLLLDTYYILISKFAGCPPAFIPALMDGAEVVYNHKSS